MTLVRPLTAVLALLSLTSPAAAQPWIQKYTSAELLNRTMGDTYQLTPTATMGTLTIAAAKQGKGILISNEGPGNCRFCEFGTTVTSVSGTPLQSGQTYINDYCSTQAVTAIRTGSTNPVLTIRVFR